MQVLDECLTRKGSGFWFHTTYQQCNRKFYFEKILRFTPDHVHPALSFGRAVHAALNVFHAGKTLDDAQAAFTRDLEGRKDSYADNTTYIADLNRGPLLLAEYAATWKDDSSRYKVISQEEEMSVSVHDFSFVVKPDRVSFDTKRHMCVIFEVKTTSFSLSKAYENAYNADQATAYLFGWNRTHPTQPCEICVPDILYNRKSVFRCERPGEIYRTRIDFEQYELGLYGLMAEIAQKTAALSEFPAIQLFPRRGDCDGDGAYSCAYRPICRQFVDPNNPPIGFHLKEKRT
jgi:hypothetical protein